MLKSKKKYLLETFGFHVKVFVFYFLSPGYSVAAQARKSVHAKKLLTFKSRFVLHLLVLNFVLNQVLVL